MEGSEAPLARPTPGTAPTVFVVDDEAPILELIRRVCRPLPARIETFTSARAFLEVVAPDAAGCLIVDYDLPDLDGLAILRELDRRRIDLPTIFVSGKAALRTAIEAFRAGSMDFLEKPFDLDELLATVAKALETDARQRHERAELQYIAERVAQLTPRERQVMDLVVSGRSNKEIAAELGVTPKTIEFHRASVMAKMRAQSLAQLVRMHMRWRTAR